MAFEYRLLFDKMAAISSRFTFWPADKLQWVGFLLGSWNWGLLALVLGFSGVFSL